MRVANKECRKQIGMMMFLQLQIWRSVKTKEIEIEIKANEVEIN